ncbi:MAG: DUF6273 domain-containing protein [Firmicutes bacterium]|nr:DUF6273 domain-containing protein [Bacillota bacterium]
MTLMKKLSGALLKYKNIIYPIIGAAAVFALCFIVLYGGENVGISDNGDFRRVLLVNNLEYKDDTDKYYLFKEDYTMKVEGDTLAQKLAFLWSENEEEDIYSSPQFFIIKLSKTLNFFANIITSKPETDYNIIWLALIYILMLSVAAWGIFSFFADAKPSLQIAVAVIFLLVFCDAGYILYFNSFYGEPLQYVALMMLISVGLLIYKRPSIPKIICFFISLYFFAGSKLSNIPYSLIICVFSLTFIFLKKGKAFKIGALVSLVAAAVCIVGLYSSIPWWMNSDTTYQSVFFGILKESDTPEEDLKALGVDEKYAVLMNTNSYMEEDEYPIDIKSEQFKADFYDKVSKSDILMFYLSHPSRFVKKLNIAISNSAYIRPPYLGNSSTELTEITGRYSLWSNVRAYSGILYNPIVIFALFILTAAYAVFADVIYLKHRKRAPVKNVYAIAGVNILALGLWINLMLPILGNGEADIAKHMFLFSNFVDILFAILLLAVVRAKPKTGIASALAAALAIFFCCFTLPKKTVEFGTYNGEPIKWEIYENLSDGTQILIAADSITEMPFDDGENLWEYSDLRQWLNSDFLAEFSEEELSSIVTTENSNILAVDYKDLASDGGHTHYWYFTRDMADNLSDTAYRYYNEDYVYIPTIDMLKNLDGYSDDYWVMCPYGNNGFMERYVNNDGFVLHTDVQNEKGVRPVIRRKAN